MGSFSLPYGRISWTSLAMRERPHVFADGCEVQRSVISLVLQGWLSSARRTRMPYALDSRSKCSSIGGSPASVRSRSIGGHLGRPVMYQAIA